MEKPIYIVAEMPPIAVIIAAIPVRIPGIDVQNDFLWSSPIASFTLLVIIFINFDMLWQ